MSNRFNRNDKYQHYSGISTLTGLAVFGPLVIAGKDNPQYYICENGVEHPVKKKTVEPLTKLEEPWKTN